jgi:hypothetical protein
MSVVIEWIQTHAAATWWLAGLSALAFVVTLIIVPIIVVRIPADYFEHPSRHRAPWADHTLLFERSYWLPKTCWAVF